MLPVPAPQPEPARLRVVGVESEPSPMDPPTRKTRGFARLPHSWIVDLHLSPGAYQLAGLLSYYARGRGECNPSNDRIAVDLGVSRREVKNRLNELEAAGIISRTYHDSAKRNRNMIILSREQECPREGTGVPSTREQECPRGSRRGNRSALAREQECPREGTGVPSIDPPPDPPIRKGFENIENVEKACSERAPTLAPAYTCVRGPGSDPDPDPANLQAPASESTPVNGPVRYPDPDPSPPPRPGPVTGPGKNSPEALALEAKYRDLGLSSKEGMSYAFWAREQCHLMPAEWVEAIIEHKVVGQTRPNITLLASIARQWRAAGKPIDGWYHSIQAAAEAGAADDEARERARIERWNQKYFPAGFLEAAAKRAAEKAARESEPAPEPEPSVPVSRPPVTPWPSDGPIEPVKPTTPAALIMAKATEIFGTKADVIRWATDRIAAFGRSPDDARWLVEVMERAKLHLDSRPPTQPFVQFISPYLQARSEA